MVGAGGRHEMPSTTDKNVTALMTQKHVRKVEKIFFFSLNFSVRSTCMRVYIRTYIDAHTSRKNKRILASRMKKTEMLKESQK